MIDDSIDKIFYFGNPKGGFKIYPSPESNTLAGYNDNTLEGWKLIAKKDGINTSYTYVLYGLLTATEGGRGGSCLGISIEFIAHYFINLNVLLNEIESIFKALIEDDRKLVSTTTSGKLGFAAEKFTDVSEYLDDKSEKIKRVLTEQHSKYIKPSDDIPEFKGNSVPAFHPESSSKLINETFEMYGAIVLSPGARLERKSPTQIAEDAKKVLEAENAELTRQLKKAENDKKVLESEIAGIKEKINQKEATLLELVHQVREFNESISSQYMVSRGNKHNIDWENPPQTASSSIKQQSFGRETRNADNVKERNVNSEKETSISQLMFLFKNPYLITALIVLAVFILGIKFIAWQFYSDIPSKPISNTILQPTPKNYLTQLSPPPTGILNNEDLKKLNQKLQIGMTANDVANKAIDSNGEDIKKAYDAQREAYSRKLIEENPDCFDRSKEFRLIRAELRYVPIYQQLK